MSKLFEVQNGLLIISCNDQISDVFNYNYTIKKNSRICN